MPTCDNCGSPVQDQDEIFCRECKPSLKQGRNALLEELQECQNKIDSAYWAFTRQANAKPPSMVVPEAFHRAKEIREQLGIF